MIIHVEQNKVKSKSQENPLSINTHHHKDLEYELFTTIGVYTSRACSNAIKEYRKENKEVQLQMTKISNIMSSRRMINAIHNVSSWPFHRSLLKPTFEDPYFQLPAGCEEASVREFDQYNLPQSKAIAIAECMFDDIQDRMHLVHGPPGNVLNTVSTSKNICIHRRHGQESHHRCYRSQIVGKTTSEEKDSSLCSVEQRM